MRHSMLAMAAALTVAGLIPLPAAAALPPTGALTGQVTDTAGRPLAEVRVVVLEANRSATTGPDGHYLISELPSGTYGVSFARIGFAPQVRRVTVADTLVTLDVRLKPTLVELPSIQVTATPTATTALTSPQPISMLSGAELAQAQAPTLGETLDGLAGVRSLSTGQGVGKPVIRGLTSNRIVVLADGQRLESQQWGDEHGPSVETATAERVEVIRGPASVLYGSDAIGGVINVVQEDLPDAQDREPFVNGTASASYATNGEAPEGHLVLEGATGGFGFRGTMTGRTSDDIAAPGGELFNSGAWELGGSGSLGYRAGWGSLSATLSRRGEEFEIHEDPAEDPAASPFQRVDQTRAAVEANLPLGLSRLQLDAGFQRNRRREFEEAGATEVALGLLSDTYTADAHFHHRPIGPLDGIAGGSFLATDVDKFGEETLVPNSLTTGYGVYVFEQAELGRWGISFGARYDHRRLEVEDDAELGVTGQTRTYNSVTGNAGLVYRVAEPVAVVFNLGRGFRAPSAYELFADGVHEGTVRYERGDPTLSTETSLNADLALRVQTDRLSAELGGFLNRIDDYIFADPTGAIDPESGFQIHQFTQGDARLVGFETAAEYHATPYLHLRGTADYTHGTNLMADQPLAFIPPFRVTYEVKLEREEEFGLLHPYLSLGGETNARQTRHDPEEFAPDGYTTFELGAGFSVPAGRTITAFDLTVRNLFDTEYRGFLSRYKLYAEDPGRSVILRVTTAF